MTGELAGQVQERSPITDEVRDGVLLEIRDRLRDQGIRLERMERAQNEQGARLDTLTGEVAAMGRRSRGVQYQVLRVGKLHVATTPRPCAWCIRWWMKGGLYGDVELLIDGRHHRSRENVCAECFEVLKAEHEAAREQAVT